MSTSKKYQQYIKNVVLGKEKLIVALTKEELRKKVQWQKQLWEEEVEELVNEQATRMKTQEVQEHLDVLNTLLHQEASKETEPSWKSRGRVTPYPPFVFNEVEPTLEESMSQFSLPKFHPLFGRFQGETRKQCEELSAKIVEHHERARQMYEERKAQAIRTYKAQRKAYDEGNTDAINWVLEQIVNNLHFPYGYGTQFQVGYEATDEEVVVMMLFPYLDEMPTISEYCYIRRRKETKEVYLKPDVIGGIYDKLQAQMALAVIARIFRDAPISQIQSVVFDGYIHGIHPVTGQPSTTCVLTVQASRGEFEVSQSY